MSILVAILNIDTITFVGNYVYGQILAIAIKQQIAFRLVG